MISARAYRWGEDGLAGISDERQLLCFAVALWNGKDPILKERLFGLSNGEGNHSEDVKEYYFYLDSTPTHSYMKFLYKYCQAAYPYDELVRTNRERNRSQGEYELLDTGVFKEDRYFDIFVEYAKADPEDILIRITVHNRGPAAATLHLLPTLWFRNTWSWKTDGKAVERPSLRQADGGDAAWALSKLATMTSVCGTSMQKAHRNCSLLKTKPTPKASCTCPIGRPMSKTESITTSFMVSRGLVNPKLTGTKASAHYAMTLEAGQSKTLRLRLTNAGPGAQGSRNKREEPFGDAFDSVMKSRRQEADEFYATVIPASLAPDAASIMRQALAGMLWSKQFYFYDVDQWLSERGSDPFNPDRKSPRNDQWHHMYNADVISMPDKWEYPWYAAWDLAFHVAALTLVDEDFGKEQLNLMLRSHYQHPNGQLLLLTNGLSAT